MMQAKLTVPHNPDASWHDWVYLDGLDGRERLVRRDAVGRRTKGIGHQWLVVHCNNGDCPAEAIVPVNVLTDAAEAALPVPVTP